MDTVFIEGLKVQGKHGVMDNERVKEQEFEIWLSMDVHSSLISNAAKTDTITDTLDYFPIRNEIVKIIQTNSFYLIETLAETIAAYILQDARVQKVELTIKKTVVWDTGVPGITIVRLR